MLSGLKMSKKRKADDASTSTDQSSPKKSYGLKMMGGNEAAQPQPSVTVQLDNDWINRSKKLHAKSGTGGDDNNNEMLANIQKFAIKPASTTTTTSSSGGDANSDAAAALRAQLMGGAAPSSNSGNSNSNSNSSSNNNIVLTNLPTHTLEREDLKFGSRKGKKLVRDQTDFKDGFNKNNREGGPSLQDLVDEETNNIGMDETYARNIARVGSRYKGNDVGGVGDLTGAGFDEEDQIDMKMFVACERASEPGEQK